MLDGVDLDWEDNSAMELGTGEQWLVDITVALRAKLPSPYLITHAPQAPYFTGTSKYKNGGYLTVHQKAGSLIDFYAIQFYNQASSSYDSYTSLFVTANGWATKTAVAELMAAGIPASKIVVGKPAAARDVVNTGLVAPADLASWCTTAKSIGWNTGFMAWQYSSDKAQSFAFANAVSSCLTGTVMRLTHAR
jgi:chitinase